VPVVCAAFVAGVALAGCSDIYFDRRDTISLGADDAVATNRLTHMVDPWPRHSENRNIAFNGERIQSAIERYRHHEVIQPRPESTSNLSQQHLSTVTEKVPSSPPTPPGASAAPVKGNGP
jgi:hypothetical protein